MAGNTFIEGNTSWYTDQRVHSSKFFASYHDFFTFCFPKHVVPDFVKFTPGAYFSIESSKVTKYPKSFYINLKTFVSHSRLPCEALFIERTLETIFEVDYEINSSLLQELTDEQLFQLTDLSRRKHKSRVRQIYRLFWKIVLKMSGYFYLLSITNLKG